MASSKLQSKTQSVPTDDQWRDLYAAANAFKSAVCWQWMENGDIFVVQDPLSRQNFFCAIMGNAGMEFGLVAYRGYGGFKLLHRLLTVEDESDADALSEDLMFLQDSLSCTFDDREALGKKDLEVIRRLGLKYRGRGEWPCFRDYTPGMVPWFLTGSQCVTLTHILEQALVVAMECKKAGNNDILFGPHDELMLRFARETPDGLKWSARFMEDTADLPADADPRPRAALFSPDGGDCRSRNRHGAKRRDGRIGRAYSPDSGPANCRFVEFGRQTASASSKTGKAGHLAGHFL